jgi:hypothetical protein
LWYMKYITFEFDLWSKIVNLTKCHTQISKHKVHIYMENIKKGTRLSESTSINIERMILQMRDTVL